MKNKSIEVMFREQFRIPVNSKIYIEFMWASKDMNSGPDSEDLCYRYMVRWFDNEDTFYEYVVCVTSHQNWPDQYGMTAPSEAVQLNEGS